MQTTLDLQPVPAPIEALDGYGAPPDRPPDATGKAFDIRYAAWQVHPSGRHAPVRVYAVDTSTGEIIPGKQRKSWDRVRYRTVPYHSCDIGAVEDTLLRLHLSRRVGRRSLDLPVAKVGCPDVQDTYLDAVAADARRSNRAADERGEYMLDQDGRVMWSR